MKKIVLLFVLWFLFCGFNWNFWVKPTPVPTPIPTPTVHYKLEIGKTYSAPKLRKQGYRMTTLEPHHIEGYVWKGWERYYISYDIWKRTVKIIRIVRTW